MNRKRFIIISSLGEPHGSYIYNGLKLKSQDVFIWYPNMFGLGCSASVCYENGELCVRLVNATKEIIVSKEDVVIFKRYDAPNYDDHLSEQDAANCGFAVHAFLEGLFEALSSLCDVVINPYFKSVIAKLKVYQFMAAQSHGLLSDSTIISNNSRDILNSKALSGEAIFKGLKTASWKSEQAGRIKALATTRIDKSKIPTDGMQFFPAIYQRLVEAKFEIRAIVMGRAVICGKITSDIENDSDLLKDCDRRLWPRSKVKIESCAMPENVKDKLFAMMDSMGLCFGAADYIVDGAGEWHFLEVNSSGNFLFLDEQCTLINTLDQFCKFAMSSNPADHSFQLSDDTISLAKLRGQAMRFIDDQQSIYQKL